MSEFSDRTLYADPIVGLRAFVLDEMGTLRSVVAEGSIREGVNEAACKRQPRDSLLFSERLWALTMPSRFGYQPEDHTLAAVNCSCGWYAYFDGRNDYLQYKGTVEAIIEGAGTSTVGSRGFRASRMRVVAVVLPAAPPLPKRRRLALALPAVTALWCAIWGTISALSGGWVGASLDAVLVTINAAMLARELRALSEREEIGAARERRFRDHYPDVEVYRTRQAALAAHPLTVPDADATLLAAGTEGGGDRG